MTKTLNFSAASVRRSGWLISILIIIGHVTRVYKLMEEEQRETQADMQGEEREEGEEDVVEIQNDEEEEGNIHQSRDESHDVPVLPNLALEAIERLRERPLDEDSVSDDFQPTRKKRKHNQRDTSTSDENEVRHIGGHAPCYYDDITMTTCLFVGSDLLYMF